jgi:hypothetical protein
MIVVTGQAQNNHMNQNNKHTIWSLVSKTPQPSGAQITANVDICSKFREEICSPIVDEGRDLSNLNIEALDRFFLQPYRSWTERGWLHISSTYKYVQNISILAHIFTCSRAFKHHSYYLSSKTKNSLISRV